MINLYIVGSLKSSVGTEEVSFESVSVDCVDGTSMVLGSSYVNECSYKGDGYFSIEQKVSFVSIDDEDIDFYDENELFNLMVGGSVFNISIDCIDPRNLYLRSLAVKFDNGMVCNLSVEDSSINSEI